MSDVLNWGAPSAPDFAPSRMATPPPAGHGLADPGTAFLTRALARFSVTLIAIAVVLAVATLRGSAVTLSGGTAMPLSALLVGLGVSGILALRLVAGPPRGLPGARRVALTAATAMPPSNAVTSRGDAQPPRHEVGDVSVARAAHGGAELAPRRGAPTLVSPGNAGKPAEHGRSVLRMDEVHEAALDSFPASDPPSWSPLRVGTPATREPSTPAPSLS